MTQSGWKPLVTSKAWNHKQADKIYFSPFFTIPGEKGRSTWLCSGYLGMCPLSTAFINYDKNAQHIPLLFINQELLTVQNHWLALWEIKYWSVWLARSKKSIFVIIALVPFSLFLKTANVFLQCEKCWRRQLDSADLPDTALLTRTEQIGRILEGRAKGNYCSILPSAFVSTNLSLLIYFLKKVRVKWRMNNLPTVVLF